MGRRRFVCHGIAVGAPPHLCFLPGAQRDKVEHLDGLCRCGRARFGRRPDTTGSCSAGNWDDDPSIVPSAYHASSRLVPVPRFGMKFPGQGTWARSAFRVTKGIPPPGSGGAHAASTPPQSLASTAERPSHPGTPSRSVETGNPQPRKQNSKCSPVSPPLPVEERK